MTSLAFESPRRRAAAAAFTSLASLCLGLLASACPGSEGSSSASSSSSGAGGGASGSSSSGAGEGVCGDSVTNPGEECDDGNAKSDDGCAPTCTSKVVMESAPLSATDEDFTNPERGLFSQVDLAAGSPEAADIRALGLSLAYAPARLDAYRDKPLDAAIMSSLKGGLDAARAAGIKVILRFTYNDGFDPDAPQARVLEHIGQIKPLLTEEADVIAAMQAGFIGAWGEWHSSTNGLAADAPRKAILQALLASLPTSRAVQIRTPMYKDAIFPGGALTDAEGFDGSEKARTGHHNDCFLASDDDMGTYDAPIATWKSYVAADGRFTPVGGETCEVFKPRSDCPTALAELSDLHFSFINSLYHPDVLSGWESQGCMSEIKRRLGYRIALESASFSERAAPGGALGLEVKLHNEGFAAMYNPRTLYVVLGEGASRRAAPLTDVDPRRWEPGSSVSITAWLRIPSDVAAGSYRLALWLPDSAPTLASRPEYAVRLANTGVWDATTGENVLTSSLTIDPSAPGSPVPGSAEFIEIK